MPRTQPPCLLTRTAPPAPVARPPGPQPAGNAVAASRQELQALAAELAACGLPVTGIMLTRLQAVLLLPGGLAVYCSGDWLVWPTGRVGSRGRPLHTVHRVADATGAARRLAQLVRAGAG